MNRKTSTSEKDAELTKTSCVRIPNQNIARRSMQLGVPKNKTLNVFQKRLILRA